MLYMFCQFSYKMPVYSNTPYPILFILHMACMGDKDSVKTLTMLNVFTAIYSANLVCYKTGHTSALFISLCNPEQ